ncbi:MFS transporter [Tsukamurella paurometabola]|uniref:MFS transporter n=1 Tax=Tsukamurella paurometabola TaxID=2061 RepID=UPI00019F0501|nr:MFS transporter [Tsukamurella paurometabola]
MTTSTAEAPSATTSGLLRLMALATGLSVAGNYLAHPILGLLQERLDMSETAAGLLVTAAQAGYAVGLVLLVPMADAVRRRPLALTLLVITAAALVAAGAAPSGTVLLVAATAAAITSVGAQVIVPYAAELAGPEHQARAVGIVMSGLVLGTVVSRFLSGVLSDLAGWRTPYLVLAGLIVLVTVALARALPRHDPGRPGLTAAGYRALLSSMAGLIRDLPVLRLRAVLIGLALGSFMVQGAAVTFLLSGSRFGWTPAAIGAIGLLGAVGALSGPTIGRFVDRGHGPRITAGGLALQAIAWLLMIPAGGVIGLPALIAGLVLMGIGQQAALNSSQAVVFSLRPEARGRINAVFMGTFFLGGTLGSAATAALWPLAGWTGACLLGSGLAGAALVLYLAFRRVETAPSA